VHAGRFSAAVPVCEGVFLFGMATMEVGCDPNMVGSGKEEAAGAIESKKE